MGYMKKLLIGIFFLLLSFTPLFNVDAYVSVKGYYRANGTYVAPHVRSNPNGLKYDNYGYKPSQGLYNSSYGTRGSTWDTPTYITDPSYYTGKSLYESNSYSVPSYTPTYTPTYTAPAYSYSGYSASAYKTISGGYSSYGIVFCDDGYYESGDSCKKAPRNGYANGTSWYCDADYVKSGSKCITLPANAYETDNGWSCDKWYNKKNNKCVLDKNVEEREDGLYCKSGKVYDANKDKCVSVK